MMDDIDPKNIYSPEIIHVVSYSEALYLATPDIINESIKITRYALKEYRTQKMEFGNCLRGGRTNKRKTVSTGKGMPEKS